MTCEYSFALYKSGFDSDITAQEIKENEEENRQFRTIGEIEDGLKEATNGMIRISNNQLGKALRMLGLKRDNRYQKGNEYPSSLITSNAVMKHEKTAYLSYLFAVSP